MDKNLEKNIELRKEIEKEKIRISANERFDKFKTPHDGIEEEINKVVFSGKDGVDYKFIDHGRQEVEVNKIDSPNIGPEDFKKHSIKEAEEYIIQGGLEKKNVHPIELLKFNDRYCVGSDGRHRVYLAKHLDLEKIPTQVKELKIL